VNFDDDAVGTDGDARAGDSRNEAAFSGGVAWIEHDRKVREFVERGDGGDVAGVARFGFERADAAFAEDYVGIAVCDDVFGGHQ